MAESNAQDKNLPASQRKLQKARADGQVARSRDLGHFAAIAGGGALLVLAAPVASGWLKDALIRALRFDAASVRNPASWASASPSSASPFLCRGAVRPGHGRRGARRQPRARRLELELESRSARAFPVQPAHRLSRLVSKAQLIQAFKAAGLALLMMVIGAFYLKTHFDEFSAMLAMPLPAAIAHAGAAVVGGLALLLLVLAAFALIDVPLQLHLHAQKLKMSHQDLKQEHKELEGNAEVKAKVRAQMREMTKRRMIAAVPKADLVVMNPTHYAVALKYDEGRMSAPRVVAKGADLLALKIRDTANEARVPVLEAPVLARALYAHAEIDREIPAALFAAVAQVLAYVYQLRAALAGAGAMPGALPALEIPDELDPHHAPAA
jgi:flagellar biosynthetic protein FlhB